MNDQRAVSQALDARYGMVNCIRQQGYAFTEPAERAMRMVPRHRFIPHVPIEQAYADEVIVTKRDGAGAPLSSASAPSVVAMMLDQLGLQPGMNVLEVGTGTGYNAAHRRWETRGSVALARADAKCRLRAQGSQLAALSSRGCGFIPMAGEECGERSISVDRHGRLQIVVDADIAVGGVEAVLESPGLSLWTNVMLGKDDPLDGMWLRMSAMFSSVCRISAQPDAVEKGLCNPALPFGGPAVVDDDSVAYLAVRIPPGSSSGHRFQLGAIGHGTKRDTLAARVCGVVEQWNAARAVRRRT